MKSIKDYLRETGEINKRGRIKRQPDEQYRAGRPLYHQYSRKATGTTRAQ